MTWSMRWTFVVEFVMFLKKMLKEKNAGSVFFREKISDNQPCLLFRSYGNDKVCICGRSKSEHKHDGDGLESNWSMAYNTLEQIDPAYGRLKDGSSVGEWTIRFFGDIYLWSIQFARLDISTPLEKVENLLLNAWNIPKARFIVSIVGGMEYVRLTDRLQTNFINGIVEIAQKSGMSFFLLVHFVMLRF